MTREQANEFINFFYSVVVSLAWINMRPVKMGDLVELLDALSHKQIRRALDRLELAGRVAKIVQRNGSSGRPCVAWVIADRDNLPMEIRYVCQNCGIGSPSETHKDLQLCEACLVAVEHGGRRVYLSEQEEDELSLYYTITTTNPNEYTLGW